MKLIVRALVMAGCLLAEAQAQTTEAPAAPPFAATPVDREVKVAEQAFSRDPQLPAWVDLVPLPDAKPKGPVTITLADAQTDVGDPVVTFLRQATRINDQLALSAGGRVSINFVPDYQRVILHTLRLWRDGVAQDRLAAAQVRFLQRENGLEHNLYSGVVTASMLIDDVRVGDTVELAYSLVGTNPVFGRTWSAATEWDQSVAVGWRRVSVRAPVARHVAWKGLGPTGRSIDKPRETVKDGIRTLTFEEKDLEPVKPEAQVPNGYALGRWLQFSEYADWQQVATWAESLFDAPEPPDPARAPPPRVLPRSATP